MLLFILLLFLFLPLTTIQESQEKNQLLGIQHNFPYNHHIFKFSRGEWRVGSCESLLVELNITLHLHLVDQ